MKLRVEEHGPAPAVDLAPMIDVIFQLLIFFLVTTTFLDRERQMEIDLPRAESGKEAADALEEIVLNVRRDGAVAWGREPVTERELEARLRAAAAAPERPVTIRGDRQTKHESVVRVMDACGRAGLRNLNIGTLDAR
ncbi:MAG TPA: biopolymer transporter ExbD [Planctomycetota bacterium]|jgi:biopolymer transport protein ExbD|nr:biopolymer transporter ExbD [Planctomycetota bacterium]